MDLPKPPHELELKNIIDKLAQFVARNGPEFEQMTKQKQKDNPKFSFLFGGEFFNYYQYRVTTEQAILKQKQRTVEQQQAIVQHVVNQQSIQSAPWQQQQQPPVPDIHDQIRQSEQNLAAQHQLLLQQQQVQVDEAIRKAQDEKINNLAKECNINLDDLENVLQPIIGQCTKDSISGGKGWIFNNATSSTSSEVTVQYILKKVTAPGTTFETKLHLVYLINDVLHHCSRKNADDLKRTLDRAVIPIFCSTSIGAVPDQQQKLHKLYKLWETNKYFDKQILDQLQNPVASLAAYQASLIAEYANIITPITSAIQNQYALLQKQHQDFVTHLTTHVHQLQHVPYAFQSPQIPMVALHPSAAPYPMMQQPQLAQPAPQQTMQPGPQQPIQLGSQQPVQTATQQPSPQPLAQQSQGGPEPKPPDQQSPSQPKIEGTCNDATSVPQAKSNEGQGSPSIQSQAASVDTETSCSTDVTSIAPQLPTSTAKALDKGPPVSMEFNSSDLPLPGPSFPRMHDDLVHPMPPRAPNGQPLPSRFSEDFSPRYNPPLHLGFMEPPDYGMTPPHIGPHHYGHPPRGLPLPLNQHDGIPHHPLPPPEFIDHIMPPTPPYYDLPAGLMVPLVKLEDTDYNLSLDPQDIRLPPPALPTERLLAAVELFYSPPSHDRARNSEGWEQLGLYEYFKAKTQAKRERQGLTGDGTSGSGEDSQDVGLDLQGNQSFSDRQPPRRKYREFKSPDKNQESTQAARGENHSKARTQSRSKSRTPPPRHRSPPHRSPYKRRPSRSPSPSRKRSPERSPTPPSFFGGAYANNPVDRRLDESNKGHQLLKKMGWGGAGLGAAEQGIQDPVDAGEVRDRQDLYKGIGISLNDPYENFRKSKGQAFINRMKARAEELGKI